MLLESLNIPLRIKTAFEVGFSKIMNYFQIISLTMRVQNHNAGGRWETQHRVIRALHTFSSVEVIMFSRTTCTSFGVPAPTRFLDPALDLPPKIQTRDTNFFWVALVQFLYLGFSITCWKCVNSFSTLRSKSMQLSLIFWQHFWGQARSCLPWQVIYPTHC